MNRQLVNRLRRTVREWTVHRRQAGDRHEGQGLIEYGLIILLIAVASIGSLSMFGQDIVLAYYEAMVAGLPF